jgi:hypothetical protein
VGVESALVVTQPPKVRACAVNLWRASTKSYIGTIWATRGRPFVTATGRERNTINDEEA